MWLILSICIVRVMGNKSLELLDIQDGDEGEYVCMVGDDSQAHLVTMAGEDSMSVV